MYAFSSFCFYFCLIKLICLNPITDNSTSRYFPERNEHVFADTCSTIFVAALLIIRKNAKQRKCPSTGECINRLCSIHIMKCYLTIKKRRMNYSYAELGWTSETLFSVTDARPKKQRIHTIYLHIIRSSRIDNVWTSLAIQWLGLHASTAVGPGSIPGWGTKIP